jgi:drug/metabolite transporter (DMT)-like permease
MRLAWSRSYIVRHIFYSYGILSCQNYFEQQTTIKSCLALDAHCHAGWIIDCSGTGILVIVLVNNKMANTAYFNSLAPVWVALFTLIFFTERLRVFFWIGLLQALGGTMSIHGLDLVNSLGIGPGDCSDYYPVSSLTGIFW